MTTEDGEREWIGDGWLDPWWKKVFIGLLVVNNLLGGDFPSLAGLIGYAFGSVIGALILVLILTVVWRAGAQAVGRVVGSDRTE